MPRFAPVDSVSKLSRNKFDAGVSYDMPNADNVGGNPVASVDRRQVKVQRRLVRKARNDPALVNMVHRGMARIGREHTSYNINVGKHARHFTWQYRQK